MIEFLNKNFYTERERNAYSFNNKYNLISELNKEKKSWSIFVGPAILIIFGFAIQSLIIIFSSLIITGGIFISNYLNDLKIEKVEQYANEYKDFLIKIEKSIREGILKSFNKRYFTAEQREEHLSDLINLINHKKNVNLTENDCIFILSQNGKEHNIELFDKEISKLEDKSIKNIAKAVIKLAPEIDFEYEENYEGILQQLCKYFERKNIEYNLIDLQNELSSQYKLLKAIQFEEKLGRDQDKKIIINEIEHLDGFEFENLIGNLFKKAGYKVQVTKKSGDQGADIIAEKDGISTAIQTKKYNGTVGNKAVQEIVAAMKFYDCDKSVVITTGTFTKAAIELAERNEVQLIDKGGLDKLFDSIL